MAKCEEFDKESGRVSETFTTLIHHSRQIEGVSQADGSTVNYRSTCGKTTCAYYLFEMHTLLDSVTIFVKIKTNNYWLDESEDGPKILTCTERVKVLRKV